MLSGNRGLVVDQYVAVYAHIRKISPTGQILWEYTSPQDSTYSTVSQALALAPDGIFWLFYRLMFGNELIPYVYKFNQSGEIMWQKQLSNPAQHNVSNAIVTDSQHLICVIGSAPVTVFVLDMDGNQVVPAWQLPVERVFGLAIHDLKLYFSGINPGGININYHGEVFKTDLSGNIIWHDTLTAFAPHLTFDYLGNLYVSGSMLNTQLGWQTVRYDPATGEHIWERYWNGDWNDPKNIVDYVKSAIGHCQGGVIIGGNLIKVGNDPNSVEGGIISYTSDGDVMFKFRYNSHPGWYLSVINSLLFDDSQKLFAFGSSYNDGNTPIELYYAIWDGVVTDVNNSLEPSIPTEYTLLQNYPNPFNPRTTISYELPQTAEVMLAVYDLLGREIVTLVKGEQPAGMHVVTFDASQISSGIYIYRLQSSTFVKTKKMLVLK